LDRFPLLNGIFQSSFVGAIAIGDLVKSTLGPKGMVSVSACNATKFAGCTTASWHLAVVVGWVSHVLWDKHRLFLCCATARAQNTSKSKKVGER
jgi:hypothetical protein